VAVLTTATDVLVAAQLDIVPNFVVTVSTIYPRFIWSLSSDKI